MFPNRIHHNDACQVACAYVQIFMHGTVAHVAQGFRALPVFITSRHMFIRPDSFELPYTLFFHVPSSKAYVANSEVFAKEIVSPAEVSGWLLSHCWFVYECIRTECWGEQDVGVWCEDQSFMSKYLFPNLISAFLSELSVSGSMQRQCFVKPHNTTHPYAGGYYDACHCKHKHRPTWIQPLSRSCLALYSCCATRALESIHGISSSRKSPCFRYINGTFAATCTMYRLASLDSKLCDLECVRLCAWMLSKALWSIGICIRGHDPDVPGGNHVNHVTSSIPKYSK